MWFKAFILLRTPISLVCLFGYALAVGLPGAVFFLGALAFLAATSIKLFRREPGALKFAGWLLALEFFGAVLVTYAIFFVAYIVIMVWTLPNAILFYKARSLFTEPAKEKPGA
jgi:hypothetical protein